jgi:glyoxylase-like metal-dependent hydrolase (beta-lactamase superfamily II)
MQIYPLSEGCFTIDKSKQFIPFNLDVDDLNQRNTGSLLVEIQPFVVVTSKDIILIDTGLGFLTPSGSLQLHENLLQLDINPYDITKVLLSHLHKDHAGGIAFKDPYFNTLKVSFPQATYYVQKKELEYAFEKGFPSYITEELEVLKNMENLVLLDGDGTIDNNIYYSISGGHCPFHQVFWIKENDETIFFGGDEAPQLQQMKSKFSAKYDFDGKKAMELRQLWWHQGKSEGWTFLFYHDIKSPLTK